MVTLARRQQWMHTVGRVEQFQKLHPLVNGRMLLVQSQCSGKLRVSWIEKPLPTINTMNSNILDDLSLNRITIELQNADL